MVNFFDDDNRKLPDGAFVLNDLLTERECDALISAAEMEGGFGYTNYTKSYRGNLRLITTDQSLADRIWERVQPFVPARLAFDGNEWEAIGLNECWRLAKYSPGDQFKPHVDAAFAINLRGALRISFFT